MLFLNICLSQIEDNHHKETTLIQKNLIYTSKDSNEIKIMMINTAWNYIQFDLDTALYYSNLALNKIKVNDYVRNSENFRIDSSTHLYSKALTIKGEIFRRMGKYDSALFYLNKSIKIRDSTDFYGFKYSYLEKGEVYLEQGKITLAQLNFNKALEYVFKGMDFYNIPRNIFSSNDFDLFLLHIYPNDIHKFKNISDYDLSQKDKFYNVFQSEGHKALFNFFEVNLKLGDLETLINNYQSALSIYSKIKSYLYFKKEKYYSADYFIIDYLYKLSKTHLELNEIDSSQKYLKLAVAAALKRPDNYILGKTYIQLSKYYLIKNQLDSFKHYNSKARIIFEKLNSNIDIANSLIDEVNGLMYFKQINDIDIKQKLDLAYRLIKNNGQLNIELQIYDAYHKYYELTNNHLMSLKYLKKKMQIKDSIYNIDFNKKIAENKELLNLHNLEYSLRQKENEIEQTSIEKQFFKNLVYILLILTAIGILILFIIYFNKKKVDRLNKELEIKNQTILDITKNKQELLSILAHDIKSPIILSSIAIDVLKENNLEESKKIEYISMIDDAISRVKILIQNILAWVNSESGEIITNFEYHNVFDIISEKLISNELKIKQKNIDLNFDFEEDQVLIDKKTFEIIIDNILNNAIKFSDLHSTISITFKNYILSFMNIGIPFDQSQLDDIIKSNKTYTKLGTANEKGTGLGLNIIINLCNLNNIKFHIESDKNKTSIILNFNKTN